MSKERKYKEFVENNKEALQLLSQKLKAIDTCRGVDSVYKFKGRQYALEVVSEWLTDLWGITTEELPEPEEDEDGLFRNIE